MPYNSEDNNDYVDGEVVQHIEYVPFGEVFVEERNNIWNTPYLFNAKEFDEETGMYYYGARYYESRLSLWMSVDRFAEKYKTSPYCFTLDNPICHYDERGDSTILYATRLPMDNKKIQSALSMATHTFIVVKRNGKPSVKFSFGSKTDNPFGGQLVKVSYMDEEKSMKGEAPSNFVKNRIVITPPSGMTVEQFDEMVIKTGNSFGNNPNITYCLEPFEQTQGNCNSSSSTLLYNAWVPLSRIKDLRKQISGLVWGFGDIKPWTVEEQSKAVQRQREFDQLRNEMMDTIILNKYQMRELSFKMVIRAYLICALMTSILGIISCSVHDIINWFPIVLLYAWIILSPISILALITVYLLGVQRDWICKIPLICLCAFIVYFINLNSSESYLINFFATQTVPYDLLYYNNGIEIRVNDTIFSIFTWVLSYFILVLFIVISTIMYRFFKKHSKIKLF